MPPVFGPRSPSCARLKSCAGSSGTAVLPSHSANSDTSGPSRYSSITTRWQDAACLQRRRAVVGDDDPLAGRERVVLDHVRRPEGVKRLLRLSRGSGHPGLGGRHPGRRHDVLGERLGPLDPRRRRIRPEHGDAGRAQRIRHPRHQRRLWPDDNKVGAEPLSQANDVSRIGSRDPMRPGERSDARIPRSGMQLANVRVGRKRPNDRMLPPARPNHKYAHVPEPTLATSEMALWPTRPLLAGLWPPGPYPL